MPSGTLPVIDCMMFVDCAVDHLNNDLGARESFREALDRDSGGDAWFVWEASASAEAADASPPDIYMGGRARVEPTASAWRRRRPIAIPIGSGASRPFIPPHGHPGQQEHKVDIHN